MQVKNAIQEDIPIAHCRSNSNMLHRKSRLSDPCSMKHSVQRITHPAELPHPKQTMAKETYMFPRMPVDRLVADLGQIYPDLGIKETDFTKPTMSRWMTINTYILNNIFGVTVEQLSQLGQGNEQHEFQYPALHEKSNYVFTLTIMVQRLMAACGIETFEYRDISRPRPKRCSYLMSGLVNFLNFHQQRMSVYEEIKERNESLLNRREQILRQNDELQQQINDGRASTAQIKEEEQEIEAKLEAVVNTWESKHQESGDWKRQNVETKNKLAEKQALVAQVNEKTQKCRSEVQTISEQIVQSPDRMKREMEHSSFQLTHLRTEKEQQQRRNKELTTYLDGMAAQLAIVEKASKLVQSISAEKDKDREIQGEVINLNEEKQSKQSEYHDYMTQVNNIKRHLGLKSEKLDRAVLQTNNTNKSLNDQKEQLKSQLGMTQAKRSKEDNVCDTFLQEMRALRQKECQAAEAHQKLVRRSNETESKFLAMMDDYHAALAEMWETVMTKIKAAQTSP